MKQPRQSDNRFRARWKQNGDVYHCERQGDTIRFGRNEDPKNWWQSMPQEDFFKHCERIGGEEQGGLF